MKSPSRINVLIACECSQVETKAFRHLGFNAFSCDIRPCYRFRNKAWHIQQDVRPLLNGSQRSFVTQDGKKHTIKQWHLIIAHPPCTWLCCLSASSHWRKNKFMPNRYFELQQARRFFFACLNACAPFVAVENPRPMARAKLPPPSDVLQPYFWGDAWSKRTYIWMRNLPPLMHGAMQPVFRSFVSTRGTSKERARSFASIANAMAQQWGDYVRSNI